MSLQQGQILALQLEEDAYLFAEWQLCLSFMPGTLGSVS